MRDWLVDLFTAVSLAGLVAFCSYVFVVMVGWP
jgi:hypothetical protein